MKALKLSEKTKSLILKILSAMFIFGFIITSIGFITNNTSLQTIGLKIYIPPIMVIGIFFALAVVALIVIFLVNIPNKIKNPTFKNFLKGLTGLYAALCFWLPPLWYTGYLMDQYSMGSFSFSPLSLPEKVFYILTYLLSLITTFVIFNETENKKK